MGFWAMDFPRYLLCYVPLIIFLYWLLFSLCLWASFVKGKSIFLSLDLANCISLWIYMIFYRNCVTQENSGIFSGETSAFKSTHDWQPFCNKFNQEPKVPRSNEAHQYKIPSDLTSCWGQDNPSTPLFQTWADCRHLHQISWKRKVWKI